jgi:hypothetical protein
MSVTEADARALNTLLAVLFDLPGVDVSLWRRQKTENRVRDAGVRLAGRAFAQLHSGVTPEQVAEAPLRVRL